MTEQQVGKLIKEQSCPWCGGKIDSHSGCLRLPRKGDMGICAECGGFLVFGDDFILEKLTSDRLYELPLEEQLKLVAIREKFDELTAEQN